MCFPPRAKMISAARKRKAIDKIERALLPLKVLVKL
jgi:hypothetical protein